MQKGQIVLNKVLPVPFCINFSVLANFPRVRVAELELGDIQPVQFKAPIAGTSLTFAFIKVQMAVHYHPFTGAVN